MIPLKLTLKNFLCYRDQVPTLDLEGVRLACLCGQNGHGKSALLDAITWALWGKARGKNQDELIYYRADDMQVDMEFEARNARYRVIRRHTRAGSRSRRGGSDIQLQIFDGVGFVPITGNVTRETQAKVEQLIGMDYDTFINSAFLLQGRADEFTDRTPGERKEVLAKIMGLREYDELQGLAKERARDAEAMVRSMEDRLGQARQQVSRRGEVERDLLAVGEELAQVDHRLREKRSEVDDLKRRVDTLVARRDELHELGQRIPRLEQELVYLQEQVEGHRQHISQYLDAVAARDSILAEMQQLTSLRQGYEQMNDAYSCYEKLREQLSKMAGAIEVEKSRLEQQADSWERRIAEELQPKADSAPEVESKLGEGSRRLKDLETEERSLEEKRTRMGTLMGESGSLQARLDSLKVEGDELRAKLTLLEGSQDGATCPLCDSHLAPEACLHLSDTYNSQIQEKRRAYLEVQAGLRVAEQEKASLEKELNADQVSLQRRRAEAQGLVATLERNLQEVIQAKGDLSSAQERVAELRRRLEEHQYAEGEHGELKEVESQLAVLSYDPEAHREMYLQIQELQTVEARHQKLLEAESSLPQEEEARSRTEEMTYSRQEELKETRRKQEALTSETGQLPQWEEQLRAASSALADMEGAQRRLLARLGDLEGELHRIQALERQVTEDQRQLTRLSAEQSVYEELSVAFGRQGVQAMLIETLLPRLEEEANVLLGRMTDHRMHLKLEAQRERRGRQGEPIETLDIKINDELGPRSYEMFSGGEAFRINLALRIALSKVLANRRGAPLPTLFIDEGFGTQDTSGRERILDVISAIEQDFQKIIVITHLEELKEAFPVRIQVEKDEERGAFAWVS